MAAVEGAARQTGSYLTHHSRADEAIRELDHREWRAVLVDITTPGASRFCHEARARRALFNVPLLGLTPQLTDLAFSNAFRWGADDVVLLGLSTPVAARLQALPEAPPAPDPARGEAVVADADRGRCDVIGRVLANAGYSVRYATDLVSARYYLAKKGVTLFVVNEELGDPRALIDEARAHDNPASWVVTAKQRSIETTRNTLLGLENVAVMSAHGPPENVLFALDFLKPAEGATRRAQVRALHGTMVFFRGEGEEEDHCGYTYSVSGNGMYIRTLLPPPTGQLWVEVEPPRAARRVRLLGRVAWARTFGQSGAETAPPGFGVKLVSGLGGDLDLWLAGFQSLEGAKPDPHVVPEVKFTPQPFRVPLPATLSQAPRTSYVSRPSQPIIAVTASGSASTAALAKPAPEEQHPSPDASTQAGEVSEFAVAAPRVERPSEGAPRTPASILRVLDALTPMPAPGENSEPAPSVPEAELPPVEAPRSAPPEAKQSESDPATVVPPPKPALTETPLHQHMPDKVTTLDHFDPDVDRPLPRTSHSEAAIVDAPASPEPLARLEAATPGHPATPSTPAPSAAPSPLTPTPAAPTALEPLELDDGARIPTEPAPAPAPTRSWGPLIALAGVVVVLSVVWASRTQGPVTESTEPVPPTTPKAPTVEAAPASTAASPAAESESTEVRTPSVDSALAATSAAPTVAASPAEGTTEPEPDPKTLAEDESWLRVQASVDAAVFVHGIDLGRTNQWLRSRCGFRFIRLGAAPGQWLSEGTPHRLPCQRALTIRVEPTGGL